MNMAPERRQLKKPAGRHDLSEESSKSLHTTFETEAGDIFSKAPFSILVFDMNGILVDANQATKKVWNIKVKEVVGRFNLKKNMGFGGQVFQKAFEDASLGKKGEFTMQFETTKKCIKDLQIKYFPLKDAQGGTSKVVFLTDDVTAHYKAAKNAGKGEEMGRGILDSLDDAILIANNDGEILTINQRLKNYLIRSQYPMVKPGMSVFTFSKLFEEKEIIETGFQNVVSHTTPFFYYKVKLTDNKSYLLKVIALKDQSGAAIIWKSMDSEKEIGILLEKTLRKFRTIYDRAPVMIQTINADGVIISVSDFWLEKMGYQRNEVIGKEFSRFLTDGFRDEKENKILTLRKKCLLRNEPYLLLTKTGEIIEVLLSATPQFDENGNFERSLNGMVDVTELRKTERELKTIQRNLIYAQRISKIGNFELDLRNNRFSSGIELLAMMGIEDGDHGISAINNIIYADDRSAFTKKLRHSYITGEDFFHVFRIIHVKSGKTRWISARGHVAAGIDGANEKMIGTFQDISEQYVAEEKIRRLSDLILLATELTETGVWEYNEEKREVYWDMNMFKIFETEGETVKNIRGLAELMVQEDLPSLRETIRKIRSGLRYIESDLKIRVKSGIKYLKTHTRVIQDEDQKIVRIVGVVSNNTEDKMLQLKLENSLEEKNVLLKEVHHRVKNNMQLISSILALKSYDLRDPESQSIFSEINERIKSMAIIHDQLYKFYNVSEINISEYLNHIADELRVLLGQEKAVIHVEAEDKLFDVDKMLLLGFIVSELVSNAFKHSFKNITNGIVRIIFKSNEKKENYLAVLNSGEPIPSDILEKNTMSLGISLIKTFTTQLNAVLTLSKDNGIEIRF